MPSEPHLPSSSRTASATVRPWTRSKWLGSWKRSDGVRIFGVAGRSPYHGKRFGARCSRWLKPPATGIDEVDKTLDRIAVGSGGGLRGDASASASQPLGAMKP